MTRPIYNVYCDESCHLEHDEQSVMVLGAVWCPLDRTREASLRLREIKARHGLGSDFEAKWKKVSPARLQMYLDMIDYFFDDDDLHFRSLIVPDKSLLDYDRFHQNHDTWYYKMYFTMLSAILERDNAYRIYLDIKDTHGQEKVVKLHDVLANSVYDFSREIIERVQQVRSHEIELLQLADLLIGAVSYVNRGLDTSEAKVALVQRIQERSNYSLTKTTLLRENKVNIFVWHASPIAA